MNRFLRFEYRTSMAAVLILDRPAVFVMGTAHHE
jgi:hypothetical protein